MILVIDNYDSFTFNLVQLLGNDVFVVKNDEVSIAEIKKWNLSHIIISPGPGVPSGAGIVRAVIEEFSGRIPILGVCLGFQAIVEVYGGKLVKAPKLFHGKTSMIYYEEGERGLFEGVKNPFEAMRYHSWIVDLSRCDSKIKRIAKTADGIPMALSAPGLALFGVQFHPESILTPEGEKMMKNFLKQSPQ